MASVWQLSPDQKHKVDDGGANLPDLVRQLLGNRELFEATLVREFLEPDFERDIHDPYLFKDMRRVVDRIFAAIDKNEPVALYGDYDADGVCSATVLASTLRALGANLVEVYLPDREREGYGLNIPAIKFLAEAKVSLLMTLDCGTTNLDEIMAAKELGIDVIVIDHHHVPAELPGAYALLNPKMPNESYPYKWLASVGMAFKVSQALLRRRTELYPAEADRWQAFEKWLLDLVAIATVTDLVPLQGENRTLLKFGLRVINKTQRPGLRALIKVMGGELGQIDAGTLGWQIGPRINAAGRMNHANSAFALLSCEDVGKADELAAQLNQENVARQKITEKITAEAVAQLEQQSNNYVLAALGQDWPIGIVGLVASRLVEKYKKPVIVASHTPFGVAGSGRSIPTLNMIEALHALPNMFTKFGGHSQACGFTLKDDVNFSAFAEKLNVLAKQKLQPGDFDKILKIEATLHLADVNWSSWEMICQLEPFGMNNPTPVFLIPSVKVVGAGKIGAEGQHLKLTVADDQGTVRPAIGWRHGNTWPELELGMTIDLVAELGVNSWNNRRDLQLKIVDLRPAVKS
jgi:single-stranded-DNA-specific exonuclease